EQDHFEVEPGFVREESQQIVKFHQCYYTLLFSIVQIMFKICCRVHFSANPPAVPNSGTVVLRLLEKDSWRSGPEWKAKLFLPPAT
ncbi:MAG: hypothetical protein WAX33_09870, partial [Rectinemataceae bacterium]